MKKYIGVLILLCVAAISEAAVTHVEISPAQKNCILGPGGSIQFQVYAYDESGFQIPASFEWRLVDLADHETVIPGSITQFGLLRAATNYFGPFKVVATERVTGLFDEALVEIRQIPEGQVARIEVMPNHISLRAGSSALFSVWCFDAWGRRVMNCQLRYWVSDFFGHLVQDVWIQPPGRLYTSGFAQRGSYWVTFEDLTGSTQGRMQVDLF